MKTRKSFKDFMAEAQSTVDVVEVAQAMEMIKDSKVQFIDVRDRQELVAFGCIPGATHASRGMLEFLVDPESPYHDEVFTPQNKQFVLYCLSGGRSMLAARRMQEMGIENVCSLAGGLKAWLEAGGETQTVEE